MQSFPSQKEETSLGMLDYVAVPTTLQQSNKKKQKSNKFSDEERYLIGKYTSVHGPSVTVKKFRESHPYSNFDESTARSLRAEYQKFLKSKATGELASISQLKRERSFMLGELNEKVKNFLHVLRRKMGVVNIVVVIATAKAFIAKNQNEYLKCIDLDPSYWAKSLFQRMGFAIKACTTSKPEIPEIAKKEAKLIFQHQIADLVEGYSIPPTLIMNFDQTPLKCAPVPNQTLSKKGSKHVAIKGLSFRQSVTATFGINFTNSFLPMQLIYGDKTVKSLPRMKFPDSFSLSTNEKHFSNNQESLKLIVKIIVPFVEKTLDMLNLGEDFLALLIICFFRSNDRSCYQSAERK